MHSSFVEVIHFRKLDGKGSHSTCWHLFQLMSQRPDCAQFFFQLADLGCKLQYPPLRDGARMLLKLIPPDIYTVECLQSLFQNHARASANGAAVIEQGSQSMSALSSTSVECLFFGTSPSQVLYHLEVRLEFKIILRSTMSWNLK